MADSAHHSQHSTNTTPAIAHNPSALDVMAQSVVATAGDEPKTENNHDPCDLAAGANPSESSERHSLLLPQVQAPRECKIVSSYLQDPSLRYSPMPLAGPGILHGAIMILGCAATVCMVIAPPIWMISTGRYTFIAIISVVFLIYLGWAIGFELWPAAIRTCREVSHTVGIRRRFRTMELGLERAVPQPGTLVRYEVHLAANKAVHLTLLQIRLVFWEAWTQKKQLRFLRFTQRVTEKRGHDLVRHELPDLHLNEGQHAVIRGAIAVPVKRPTEHYRGKFKHLSYINLTVTLFCQRPSHRPIQGNCPRLVTFPWI